MEKDLLLTALALEQSDEQNSSATELSESQLAYYGSGCGDVFWG